MQSAPPDPRQQDRDASWRIARDLFGGALALLLALLALARVLTLPACDCTGPRTRCIEDWARVNVEAVYNRGTCYVRTPTGFVPSYRLGDR